MKENMKNMKEEPLSLQRRHADCFSVSHKKQEVVTTKKLQIV